MSRQGREVDHSPPSNAEVKNQWSYTFHPPTRLHGLDKNNLTLRMFYSFDLISGPAKIKIRFKNSRCGDRLLCLKVPYNSSVRDHVESRRS